MTSEVSTDRQTSKLFRDIAVASFARTYSQDAHLAATALGECSLDQDRRFAGVPHALRQPVKAKRAGQTEVPGNPGVTKKFAIQTGQILMPLLTLAALSQSLGFAIAIGQALSAPWRCHRKSPTSSLCWQHHAT